MQDIKYLPFTIKFSFILILFDVYFLYRLKKLFRERNINNNLFKLIFTFSLLMIGVTLYNIWVQFAGELTTYFKNNLFLIKDLWYLPKLLIVPIMIIYDFTILIKNYNNWKQGFEGLLFQIKYIFINLFKLPNKILIGNKFEPLLASNENVNFQLTEKQIIEDSKQISNNQENQDISIKNDNQNIDIKRRKILQNITWTMAGVPFIIVGKGIIDTTYDFQVRKEIIKSNKFTNSINGLKIIQISDIHAGSFSSNKPFDEAVRIIVNENPDIILMTGDFVNYSISEIDYLLNGLKHLKADLGIYACLGNHDHYMPKNELEYFKTHLIDYNINLLDNSSKTLNIGSTKLQIAGIDNYGYGQYFGNISKATSNCKEENYTILLAHDPSNWDREVFSNKKVDLMLSGHTHGGQMGIEFFNFIITPARILYNQFAGMYKYGDRAIYVNRGLGTTGPPLRVGIRPEITLFEFYKS